MSEADQPRNGEMILYQTPGGAVRVEVLYESETFWLNQKKMAELFGVDVRTVSEHLTNIFADKIRSGWRVQHWRAPRLEVFDQPERVGLTLPTVSLIPEDTLHRLRERFGPLVDGLAPPELQALATAHLEGAVSNARLQQLLADHPVDITRMLAGLCGMGLLVSDSRRRWTTYQLPRTEPAGSSLTAAPVVLGQGGEDSGHLSGDSGHLPGESGHLPGTASEELTAAASPIASTRKAPASRIREVIATLCRKRFLTPAQLGNLLDRNPEGIRKRYLVPMVREGKLRLRFPEATNRPDQAYTAVEDPE